MTYSASAYRAPETLLLDFADLLLRKMACLSVAVMLTCTPSVTTSKPAADPPPTPPQCIDALPFLDLAGEEAFICMFADSSEYSWNGWGAQVFHPYLDGFAVGPVVDLYVQCSGEVPACVLEPTERCITPAPDWYVDTDHYAICRTNAGEYQDFLEIHGQFRSGPWEFLALWNTSDVCAYTPDESDDPEEPEEPVRE